MTHWLSLRMLRVPFTPVHPRNRSVSRSSRQRPASEGWCGTPPYSVSLGAAALAGCEEDEALELAAAVRARFGAILRARFGGIRRESPIFLRVRDAKLARSPSLSRRG